MQCRQNVELFPSSPHADETPSPRDLIFVKWRDGSGCVRKWQLREALSHSWRSLGQVLGFSDGLLKSVAADHRGVTRDCWDAVLSHWLASGSTPLEDYPGTWRGLIAALEDVGGFQRKVKELCTALENKCS